MDSDTIQKLVIEAGYTFSALLSEQKMEVAEHRDLDVENAKKLKHRHWP